MAYGQEEDLEFLRHCSDDDLSPLVEPLTKGSGGNERLTEELTMRERYYKEHQPDHQRYRDLIAAELDVEVLSDIRRWNSFLFPTPSRRPINFPVGTRDRHASDCLRWSSTSPVARRLEAYIRRCRNQREWPTLEADKRQEAACVANGATTGAAAPRPRRCGIGNGDAAFGS